MKWHALAATATALILTMGAAAQESWLSWTADTAREIGQAAYRQGRVGRLFTVRLLKTERAFNYKLAATLFSPDVIHATARWLQLSERLSDADARRLVAEADAVDGLVVQIEIDPREGSGVIPLDWDAFLQPIRGNVAGPAVRGVVEPKLREVRALGGVRRRNYDYDRYWVVFPRTLEDGTPLSGPDVTELELVVRIYDSEGKVRWRMPLNRSQ